MRPGVVMVWSVDRPIRRVTEVPPTDLVIGREMTEPDVMVSKKHALVSTNDGALFVEDLRSTNGTYVDAHQISGKVKVRDGAILRTGDTVWVIVADIEMLESAAGDGVEQEFPVGTKEWGSTKGRAIVFHIIPDRVVAAVKKIAPSLAIDATVIETFLLARFSKLDDLLHKALLGARKCNEEGEKKLKRRHLPPIQLQEHSKLTVHDLAVKLLGAGFPAPPPKGHFSLVTQQTGEDVYDMLVASENVDPSITDDLVNRFGSLEYLAGFVRTGETTYSVVYGRTIQPWFRAVFRLPCNTPEERRRAVVIMQKFHPAKLEHLHARSIEVFEIEGNAGYFINFGDGGVHSEPGAILDTLDLSARFRKPSI